MLKKFFHAALVLPLVLFAVSCSESNDDGGKDKPVVLSPDTKLEQQVYADDEQAPAPIKFTATAPWTATVAAVPTKAEAGSEVDWLTLSAYKGGAGEVALTMTLSPNYTGTDRKAEIRIACGGTVITITVEQKGTTESGEKPQDPDEPEPDKPTDYALVESIDVKFWIGCEDGHYRGSISSHYVFRYDDRNRIAEYEFTDYTHYTGEAELDSRFTTRFDYTIQDEIRLTEKADYGENSAGGTQTRTYRIQLDGQGRATRIAADKSNEETDPITYRYDYNDEGRLSRISWFDPKESPTEIYEAMNYRNGVISQVISHYGDEHHNEIIFPSDAFSDRPNDRLNIDPNWLLFTEPDEPQMMLPMLRLTGKNCDRLTIWTPDDYDENLSYDHGPGMPEPNVTIHKTQNYRVHETTARLQYTFNDDGTIATIVKPIDCIAMRYEYDIVVGNELYDPGQPEIGYKYTIKNETRREVGRSTDRHEWTFTYRK